MARGRLLIVGAFVCLFVAGGYFLVSRSEAVGEDVLAEQILTATGVKGGLIIHLNCGAGALTAALGASESYTVCGLDPDAADITAARAHIESLGAYGRITAQEHDFDGLGTLPYIENLVNLVVSEVPLTGLAMAEVMRVLAPHGVAYINDGGWVMTVKPRPAEMDEWTQYLHDGTNNAVSNDDMIQPPARFQWLGSPRYSRHHDHMASVSAYVATEDRVFYIIDEGSKVSIQLPSRWWLYARDAFNGTVLWKKPIDSWMTQIWPFKSGPAQLPRRLIAVGDSVYVTLGMDFTGLSRVNAATGEVVWNFNDFGYDTVMTEEIIYSDGVLFAMVKRNNPITNWNDYVPIDRKTGTNKTYVADTYPWDEQDRALMAIDASTGTLLWEETHAIAPLTLGADSTDVYFHNGSGIVRLDRTDGSLVWESSVVSREAAIPPKFGPTLVIDTDEIIFLGNDPNLTIRGISKATGEILWWDNHHLSGHNCPYDLFVIDGKAWTGATAKGNDSGTYSGWNTTTGVIENEFDPNVETHWFHQRCYRSRATDNYILPSRNGIEFVDFRSENWTIHHWIRGGCLFGILPANGLIYTPPTDCACYFESKTFGFTTVAPALANPDYPQAPSDAARLTQGPAYGQALGSPTGAEDWPTYRHDGNRSGKSPTVVPADLLDSWQTDIGGRLSTLTVANGRIYVAQIDKHIVHALDEATGNKLWSFRADGRVDSPPAIYKGRVIFGSADGHVYCLRASDGALIWRFQGAPEDLSMPCWEQLESVWPIHGSVLVQNDGTEDVVYCVAGRNMFLDGGLRFLKLNPETGAKIGEVVLDENDPDTGENLQIHIKSLNMPVAMVDVLSSDGEYVYMHSQRFDLAGNRQDIAPYSKNKEEQGAHQYGVGMHLFSPTGFLDDWYVHRSYWVWGKSWASGAGGWHRAGDYAPAGRMMVLDDTKVYGYGRQPQYWKWSTPLDYHLWSAEKYPASETIEYQWSDPTFPILTNAMVLADKILFVAGPEDIMDEEYIFDNRNEPNVLAILAQQDDLLDDMGGGLLRAVSIDNGVTMAQYDIESIPVWDGMVAANGKLYISLKNGKVICIKGGNYPPVVTSDKRIKGFMVGPTVLDVTVSDDGLPVQDPEDPCSLPIGVTSLWSKISGPGTVSFDDASSVDTTVLFSERGDYVLRLNTDDGGATYYDDLDVRVLRPGDTDADNDIDEIDLDNFALAWMLGGCDEYNDWCGAGDQIGAGTVGSDSFAVVAANWLLGIEPAAPRLLTAKGSTTEVLLDWLDNDEDDLDGYNVYRSETSGSGYVKINSSPLTISMYVDTPPLTIQPYCYVVKAVDTSGYESLAYSNEVSASIGTQPKLKLVAGDGMTYDVNDLVVQWLDRSGNGNHATQSTGGWRPAYIESAINGHPAVDFAGAGIHLEVADSDDINKADDYNAKTLLVVFKTGSDVTTKQVIWEQGGNKIGGLNFYIHEDLLYINGWALKDDAYPDWGLTALTTTVLPDTVYIATMVMNSGVGTFEGFVNGSSIGVYSGIDLLPKHGNDCALGHTEGNSRFHNGSHKNVAEFGGLIAEFYSYNAVLTTAKREALEAYLIDKYGL